MREKKLKVTNSMLRSLREKVRPKIIENLQQNLTNSHKFILNSSNFRLKFLNQFYLFNGLPKYYEYLKKVATKDPALFSQF